MKINTVVIVAIIALVTLQLAAMYYGINGTFRTIIFTAIAALAGLSVDMRKFIK